MLKRSWIAEHRIPAHLFHSLRVSVEGKVRAVRASMQRERERIERAIGRAERFIRRLESQDDSRFRVHHKRRRLFSLRSRLAAVENCPPRQAARCLPEGHRQATGYFQKHGQEVRRLASSPHQPDSQTDYPISNSAPYQRTFSLST